MMIQITTRGINPLESVSNHYSSQPTYLDEKQRLVNDNGDIVIYTDGSYYRNKTHVGIGVYSPNVVEACSFISIEDSSTAPLTAETNAILYALQRCYELNIDRIEIRSDCLWAVDYLNGRPNDRTPNLMIFKTIKSFMNLFSRVSFVWVRGHSSDRGNNIADNYAKCGSQLKTSVDFMQ